jgi:hypothetical protein
MVSGPTPELRARSVRENDVDTRIHPLADMRVLQFMNIEIHPVKCTSRRGGFRPR